MLLTTVNGAWKRTSRISMSSMESCDTNILLHAYNLSSPLHEKAFEYLEANRQNSDFVICELVLIELYVLLRNPGVVANPLSAEHAVAVCSRYRSNPDWRVVDYPGNLMDKVWTAAAVHEFSRRSILDAKIAYTLTYHGVEVFATRNVKHFGTFGFERIWNPLD